MIFFSEVEANKKKKVTTALNTWSNINTLTSLTTKGVKLKFASGAESFKNSLMPFILALT